MNSKMSWAKVLTEARQAGIAALGLIGMFLNAGYLKPPWDVLAGAVIFVATYYGVYKVPNKPPASQITPPEPVKAPESGQLPF